jgi:hypothetical protein
MYWLPEGKEELINKDGNVRFTQISEKTQEDHLDILSANIYGHKYTLLGTIIIQMI